MASPEVMNFEILADIKPTRAIIDALLAGYLELGIELLDAVRRCGQCDQTVLCHSCTLVYRRLREVNDRISRAIERAEGG